MQAFSITDIGKKRKLNQDYTFSSVSPIGVLPNLFMVADGMGGHNGGDYASKYTVECIENRIRESAGENKKELFREAILGANDYVREMARMDMALYGMGTTLVGATITDNELLAVNVGDSRLYVIGNGEIEQVTIDHSLVSEMVLAGSLDVDMAKDHPKKNIITRAVGVLESVEPDFFERTLYPGDIVLLCSDGLTNMVDDNELFGIVMQDIPLPDRGRELIARANENGGKDNIAVVLVDPFA